MERVVRGEVVLEWYAVVMTPLGVAVDARGFYRAGGDVPAAASGQGHAQGSAHGHGHGQGHGQGQGQQERPERHNVDKNMLAQDLSLVSAEVTLKARVAAATALAQLVVFWPVPVRYFLFCVGRLLTGVDRSRRRTTSLGRS